MLLKSGAWLHYSTPVTDLLNVFRVPFSFLIVHTRTLLPEEWFICCGIPDKFEESRLPWADRVSFASGQMPSQPVKLAEHRLLKNWTFSTCKISLSINNFSSHDKRFEQLWKSFHGCGTTIHGKHKYYKLTRTVITWQVSVKHEWAHSGAPSLIYRNGKLACLEGTNVAVAVNLVKKNCSHLCFRCKKK